MFYCCTYGVAGNCFFEIAENRTPSYHGGSSYAYSSSQSDTSRYNVSSGSSYSSVKSSTIILLTIFLGGLGVHRFRTGKIISGILYACTLGFLGIGVAIDLFLIATDKFDDSVDVVSESEKKICWIIGGIILFVVLAALSNS